MSTGPIAVLDTDILILAIGDDTSHQRTETVRARLKIMRERGYTLWIPSPAIAELLGHGRTTQELSAALVSRLGGLRIADFDLPAAETCGRMIASALETAGRAGSRYESTRAAMKFDAQIAAVAHSLGARYLLTANARDIGRHLVAVNSPTQVHRADQPDTAFAWQPELPGTSLPEEQPQPEQSRPALSLTRSSPSATEPGPTPVAPHQK